MKTHLSCKSIFGIALFTAINITCAYGQKMSTVILQFPKGFNCSAVNISYDDGKEQKPLHLSSKNGQFVIKKKYFSIYASITLQYQRSKYLAYRNSFFFDERPAKIVFLKSDSAGSPFEKYRLTNCFDFKKEKDFFAKNNANEYKNLENYITALGDKFEEMLQDTVEINQHFNPLQKCLKDKNTEIVKSTSSSYYSFWFFRRNLSYPSYVSADSVLSFMNSTFPDKFLKSVEGKTLIKKIQGLIEVKIGGNAPDFTCRDINGHIVSLSKYRTNNKYVLLNFWATWCVPCIREMPVLKRVHEKYAAKGVEVVSVCISSKTKELFYNTIKKQGMTWVNIYDNVDIENIYCASGGVPKVYLINPAGVIIYDREIENGNENLDLLFKKLKEVIVE